MLRRKLIITIALLIIVGGAVLVLQSSLPGLQKTSKRSLAPAMELETGTDKPPVDVETTPITVPNSTPDDMSVIENTTDPASEDGISHESEPETPSNDGVIMGGEPITPQSGGAKPENTEFTPDSGEESVENDEYHDILQKDGGTGEFVTISAPSIVDGGYGIVVYNYEELSNALTSTNGYTHIYLGSDIEMTSGIIVNAQNSTFTIDGVNPLEPEAGRHTLTESSSAAIAETILLIFPAQYRVSLKNMIITGKNYFGTIGVMESIAADITYENIEYTGPQLGYNVIGTCRLLDSVVSITNRNGSPSAIEELFQARHVVFGGDVVVTGSTTTHSLMWLMGAGATLTVLDSADVTLNVVNNYTIFSDNAVECNIGTGASFTVNSRYSMFYDNSSLLHLFKNLTVNEGASFAVHHGQRNAITMASTLKVSGIIKVMHGAEFIITAAHPSAEPLIRFISDGAGAEFNEPCYAVLSNKYGKLFDRNLGSGGISLTADTVCYWDTSHTAADASGFAVLPTRFWHKYSTAPVSVTAKMTGSSSYTVSSDVISGIDYGGVLDGTSFNLNSAHMLTFGQLPLTLDSPPADSGVVTGGTLPYVYVKMEHSSFQAIEGQADAGGLICVYVPTLDYPGEVYVTARKDLLYRTGTVPVSPHEDGEEILSFLHIPDKMSFGTSAISLQELLIKRDMPEWTIVIGDTRDEGSPWYLDVRVKTPVTGENGDIHPDALILDGEVLGIDARQFAQGVRLADKQSVKINWNQDEGIMLRFPPVSVYAGKYTATVEWILTSGP